LGGGPDRRAFTLIELLTVIAIIMILAALLFQAILAMQRQARRTRAVADVAAITQAFKQYYNDYQHWPTNLALGGYDVGDAETTATGIETSSNLVAMLAGQDIAENNPRQIVFYQAAPELVLRQPRVLRNQRPPRTLGTTYVGSLVDPWGSPYKYMCDFNDDGVTHVEFSNNSRITNIVGVGVAVWSQGPDGRDQSGFEKDDILSWQ
jgi:prepilin-type N-terminal cleavage/methylation domain-containing protein